MSYQQAYDYILSLGNIAKVEYQKNPRDLDWYIKRLQFFLKLVGNPEKKIPHFIHVAGTSGKGSVSLMIYSILRAAKKRVGILTSPHPSVILERWEVNGKIMSKHDFARIVTSLKPKIEEYIKKTPYDMLSFSELMTAMALIYFKEQKVKWVAWETACGGRHDTTNVIPKKDVAVITNIGLDHVDLLGGSKQAICYEKAGIIKKGCHAFTTETASKMLRIIKKECKKTSVNLSIIKNQESRIKNFELPALGKHQQTNAALAIAVARWLKISEKYIVKGLKQVKLPLRVEVVSHQPTIIVDGAHSGAKMKTTVSTVKDLNKNIHLLVGFSANKDISTMIKQLSFLKPKTICCTRFTSNPYRKTENPAKLATLFKRYLTKVKINIFLDPDEALVWSRKQTKIDDLLLITGSIFLSGQLRPQLIKKKMVDSIG